MPGAHCLAYLKVRDVRMSTFTIYLSEIRSPTPYPSEDLRCARAYRTQFDNSSSVPSWVCTFRTTSLRRRDLLLHNR